VKIISPNEARNRLWKKGNLQWKLDPNQEQLYTFINTNPNKIIVLACSRQMGKSWLLCTLAIEQCLKTPNSIVALIAPEVKVIKRILRAKMREILIDCPKELAPEYKTVDHIYKFPNGSEIQIAGTDNGHAESLRGIKANLCIVDEAGFCSDLDYIVKNILIPTTTNTDGKIILSSTPPKTNDHDFVKFWQRAELVGSLIIRTIYNNPRLNKKQIEDLAEAIGGIESVSFRREYLCELITSEEDAVVPEFNEALRSKIVKEWIRPPYYDAYASMDIGFRDLTVVLLAYYDFRKGKLIIEDELVIKGDKFLTHIFAKDLRDKEQKLWINSRTGEAKEPYLRVADNNNLILLNDLQVQHRLTFMAIAKDNSDAALNNMRMMLKQERIIINPRCITLINHLKHAIWNKARNNYVRSADNGHADAVDSLKYLCRGIQMNKNPYPDNYAFEDMKVDDMFVSKNLSQNNKLHEDFLKLFAMPRKKRVTNK
jgi:hypothetical protein